MFAVVGLVVAGCAGAGEEARIRSVEAAPNVRSRVMVVGASARRPEPPPRPSTSPADSPQPRARRTRAPIALAFAGDTSFHGAPYAENPIGAARQLLSNADVSVVNLETAVAPAGVGRPPVDKAFLFRSDPASIGFLADAGVDVVTLANNHALDYGPAALEYGIDQLRQAGIAPIGAGGDDEAAISPIVLEVGDWTVGMIAFSRVPCDWSWQGRNVRPQVAWACPPFLDDATEAVTELAEVADATVVLVHGGTEGEVCADAEMTDLNRRWAAAGADLVVNSHPHVVQGITSIGDAVVVNSTGNFAFPPSIGLTARSAVFVATVSEQGLFVSVHPFVAPGGVVRAATPAERASILSQVDSSSVGWSVLADGRAIQDPGDRGVCAVSAPTVAAVTG